MKYLLLAFALSFVHSEETLIIPEKMFLKTQNEDFKLEVYDIANTELDFMKELLNKDDSLKVLLDCHSFIQGMTGHSYNAEGTLTERFQFVIDAHKCQKLLDYIYHYTQEGKKVCINLSTSRHLLEVSSRDKSCN